MFALAAAAVFGAIGIAALAWPRLRSEPIRVSLGGVGELSAVTVLVGGVASLIVAYHIVTHALGLMDHFRAPLWMAFVGAGVAVFGSIGIDAIDNRREAQEQESKRDK